MKIYLVLEIKNVVSFIKTRFYLKRGCIKIRKRSMLTRATIATCCFCTNFAVFKIEICGAPFQTLFARVQCLTHSNFLYENELLQHSLSYNLRQMATLLDLCVQFFQQARLFSDPEPGFGSGF